MVYWSEGREGIVDDSSEKSPPPPRGACLLLFWPRVGRLQDELAEAKNNLAVAAAGGGGGGGGAAFRGGGGGGGGGADGATVGSFKYKNHGRNTHHPPKHTRAPLP